MFKHYEPFGEALVSYEGLKKDNEAGKLPGLRIGVAAFWLIAMALVVARAAYLDPTSARMISAVAEWFGHIRSLAFG